MVFYDYTDALYSVPHFMTSEIYMCTLNIKTVTFSEMGIADMYARYGWGFIPPDDLL